MDFPEATTLNSAYFHLVGQQLTWLDTDNEATYLSHMSHPQKRDALDKLKWNEHNITYKINQHGFRSPEFKKDEPNIVFLGCSHTVGVGINLSDTFSHHVSQSLGLQNYNLGKGGGSSKTCFRLGEYWIPKLKPKIVVLLSPAESRTEIILHETPCHVNEHFKEDMPHLYPYYKNWIAGKENGRLEYVAAQAALEKISNDAGALFVGLDSQRDIKIIDKSYLDLARDLQHPGRIAHKRTAAHILAKIQKV